MCPDIKTPLELGLILKTARQAQNLELAELSVRTGLPEKYLLALERGTHDELPGRAYARIYYLNYARALRLDYEGLMQSWSQPPSDIEPAPAGGPRKKGTVFVWLGIPLVGLALWGIFRGTASISQRAIETPGYAAPDTTIASAGTLALAGAPAQDSPESTGAADTVSVRRPSEALPAVDSPPLIHRLRLVSRAASWVVIEADGDTVEAQVLERGGELTAEASTDFVLTILLPTEIVATLDGEPLEMPEGGTRSLLRHRFALKDREHGP